MIINDKSHGSLTVFSDEQLVILNQICFYAEKNMVSVMPEPTKPYNLNKILRQTNVWLVPKTAFIAHMKSWCMGAKEFYDTWYSLLTEEDYDWRGEYYNNSEDAEIIEIPKDIPTEIISCDESENANESKIYMPDLEVGHDRRVDDVVELDSKKIAETILKPWSHCLNENAEDEFIKYFPLGWFDGREIYICLDLIAKHCNYNSDKTIKISATVLLHELAHAMMHNGKCGPNMINKTPYLYWAEEAMANKIMLHYLNAYDSQYFIEAVKFVAKQAEPYNFGIALYKNHVGDYAVFREQKAVTDLKEGIRFLKLMCQLQFRCTFAEELNRTFYRMMNVYSLLDDWTGKRIGSGGAVVYNNGTRIIRVEIGGWNEAYLRMVQILLMLKFPNQIVSKALKPIGNEKSSKLVSVKDSGTKKGPVINMHGSASKMQERIKYVLDKLCIPYSDVRIYTER